MSVTFLQNLAGGETIWFWNEIYFLSTATISYCGNTRYSYLVCIQPTWRIQDIHAHSGKVAHHAWSSRNIGVCLRGTVFSKGCLCYLKKPVRWFLGTNSSFLKQPSCILPMMSLFHCLLFISCWLFLPPCSVPSGDF